MTSNNDFDDIDLDKLNSLTQYPSIPTYHKLDNGKLTDRIGVEFTGMVNVTEKIDGANGRIIVFPDGTWVIGGRKNLLARDGQRIYPTNENMVDTLRPYADNLAAYVRTQNTGDRITVAWLEAYGTQQAARLNYGDGKTMGARLFDVAVINTDELDNSRERISQWRDDVLQPFEPVVVLPLWSERMGVELVPQLATIPAEKLPVTLQEMQEKIAELVPTTRALLTPAGKGFPEGIVIRQNNRLGIAKARIEDYVKAMRTSEKSRK